MKFIFQLIGNLFCFLLYTIIGLQFVNTGITDILEFQTITWLELLKAVLFFSMISLFSILTTYSFTYALKPKAIRQKSKESSGDTEISPEVIIESGEEKPESIMDILTDSTNKIIRENSPKKRTPTHHRKKSPDNKKSKKKK